MRVATQTRATPETGSVIPARLLRIGASTAPGLYYLPAILARFHRRHPAVDLHYEVANSLDVQRMLVKNEIDLGIVGSDVTEPALVCDEVARDEIVVYAAPNHELASRKRIDPRKMGDQIWVLREKGSATRELFLSQFRRLGGDLHRTIELASPEAAKALVTAGVGVSFMSSRGLERDLRGGDVVVLPVSGLRVLRPIYCARHVDKTNSAPMKAFLALMGPP